MNIGLITVISSLFSTCVTSSDCPSGCICQNYNKIVKCDDAGFITIPNLPIEVEILSLDNNDLRWLDEAVTDFSKYENLTQISIESFK